jgi:tRNA1Val (adenine37-N6)-methyltransferase
MFHFKQFSIDDSNCGMKIGVDGVLLGAWAQHNSPKKILDVGTGSGLIALMMAQKYPEATIHAVELEADAARQSNDNFTNAPFDNKFILHHSDYLLINAYNIKQSITDELSSFDIIVANLPYFNEGGSIDNVKRELARSSKHLPLQDFLQKSESLLEESGSVYFIYPNNDIDNIGNLAKDANFHIESILNIKGNESTKSKRSIFKLSKRRSISTEKTKEQSLIIEVTRGEYTDDYKELCRAFYLKF